MATTVEYIFTAEGLAEDSFTVVSFAGREQLCRPYEYTLQLKSTNVEIDLEQLRECRFTFAIGESKQVVHGILANFQQLQQSGDFALYQAKLVPHIWRLGLFRTNEVYLEQNIEETITQVLEETGLIAGRDFECRLSDSYRTWPFRVQYSETFLDFIHRIIERDGISYFFDQSGDSDTIIFTDNGSSSQNIAMKPSKVKFRQAGGINVESASDTVTSFLCCQQPVPAKVVVKDYNDESPLVDISGEATVDLNAWGEVFIYGDNLESPDEAKQIAQIRAEELLCRKKQYHGEGLVNRMQPGYLFSMSEHFRQSYNRDYLMIKIEHQGFAPGFLTHWDAETDVDKPLYRNSFTVIESDIRFRPERIVQKQRIYGTLNANIDAEGDGEYAELDEVGRYRVTLPFDRVLRGEGKASHWVRMAQPYVGEGHGMHFPLHKGTEVLLTFIEGDPDRPIISGAVPNHLQTSVVDQASQTNSRIKTASGNMIELEDQDGTNRVKLKTGDDKTYMHLGSPNAAGDGWTVHTAGSERKVIERGQQTTVTTGSLSDVTVAAESNTETFDESAIFGFIKMDNDNVSTGTADSAFNANDSSSAMYELSGEYCFQRMQGPLYQWHQGSEYRYMVGAGLTVTYADNTTASSGYTNTKDYSALKSDLMDDLYAATPNYAPGGARIYDHETSSKTWSDVIKDARVSLARHDTISGQKGNIYDFGGYWNYNLGNSYEENFLAQKGVTMNNTYAMDILEGGGPKYTGFKSVLSGENLTNKFQADDVLNNVDATTNSLCVTKNINVPSYEFSYQCNNIEINDSVNEITINKGGVQIETVFSSDGHKVLWTKETPTRFYEKRWADSPENEQVLDAEFNFNRKQGMWYEETTWNQNGDWISFTSGFDVGGHISHNTTEILGIPEKKVTVNLDVDLSFEVNVGVSSTFIGKFAASTSLELYGTASLDIKLGWPAINAEIDLSLPGLVLKKTNDEFECNIPGALKARSEQRAADIKNKAQIELTKNVLQIAKENKIGKTEINITMNTLIMQQNILALFS
ncbi:MAG: type VI secretion system tip protein VgrG [Gammaproteobacteria bacterium]|nr:type VI secretion system tip protein VgrG [Gammaproteobacteria bacterium]